ncbi:MAG: LacI family DNA-binding transcriptional regulator [Lysobacter sp.]|nr:LacI family DNA-binding transcriptional regulator [Lysobacter sp.]
MRKSGGAGVRIDDVARAAGVSMKTVSRVFNQEPNVRPETRAKVEAAAKALNFRPNPSARSLAGRRSYLISTLYDNPSSSYVMQVVSGVLDACEAAHYSMMMRPVDYASRDHVDAIADSVAQYAPDGLVLTPPLTDDEALLERLQAMGVRYASISPREQNARIGARLDERRAVREMMAYIVGLGHRRIGHIKGHRDHGAAEWRLQGYRDGLADAGIAYDKALVVPGEFVFESGTAGAEALLSLPEPPTAIFAANDDTAAGVLHTAARRGVRVPQDLSVFGFDDLPMARQLWPSLTTVRQASRDMGRIATEQLLLSIRDPLAGGVVQVPYELVFRESTGPAPGHAASSKAAPSRAASSKTASNKAASGKAASRPKKMR